MRCVALLLAGAILVSGCSFFTPVKVKEAASGQVEGYEKILNDPTYEMNDQTRLTLVSMQRLAEEIRDYLHGAKPEDD